MDVNHFIPKEKHYTRPLIIGLILSITISYCLYSCKKNSIQYYPISKLSWFRFVKTGEFNIIKNFLLMNVFVTNTERTA